MAYAYCTSVLILEVGKPELPEILFPGEQTDGPLIDKLTPELR